MGYEVLFGCFPVPENIQTQKNPPQRYGGFSGTIDSDSETLPVAFRLMSVESQGSLLCVLVVRILLWWRVVDWVLLRNPSYHYYRPDCGCR